MIGTTIGQYRVLDRLGQGGMGSVYRAADEMLDREVALKVLDGDVENGVERFRAEAVALARLSHAGIATVYELFEHDGRLIMAMELVQGRTLQEIADQMGAFPAARAADMCIDVLNALAHAHAAGIVHRDLKPANLMVTSGGAIKILDFGIARLDGSVHLTSVGFTMGSPAYMAPEQVEGRATDARVDLYAMGVVFYRLVAGELPFKGDTPVAMAQSQKNDAPTPIESARPDAPPWVGEIISRALAKAPEARFQSALEFRDALAHARQGWTLALAAGLDQPTEAMRQPDFSNETSATPSGRGSQRRAGTVERVGVTAMIATIVGLLWIGIPNRAAAPAPVVADQIEPPPDTVPVTEPATAAASAAGSPAAPTTKPKLSPTPTPTPTASPAKATTPAVEAAAPALFDNVKLLTVSGKRTTSTDVSLTFARDQLIAARDAANPLATIPYRGAAATYVYAADPQWNPDRAAPADKIDVPGIFGRKRHWLVVQTSSAYAILQLDGGNWSEVLKTFEARTGATVGRPADKGK